MKTTLKNVQIFLVCASVTIFIPTFCTQQCYKRCNCLHKNFPINHCTQDITDLNLYFDTKEIAIYCKKLISVDAESVQTFDASYLSVIDDKSPLTLEAMIRKCYKTKRKTIKYAINSNKLHNINATDIVLNNQHTIKYLKIHGSPEINKQIHIISIVGPQLGYNLKELIVNRITVPHFKNYFENIPNIETLDLTSNNIEKFPQRAFSNLTRLKNFVLRENKIKYLDQLMFDGSTNITSLDFSNNMIDYVENTTFLNLKDVRYLNLSYNNLKNIWKGTFSLMFNLEQLDLSKNSNLTLKHNVFEDLSSLISLNLSECHIEHIPERLFLGCQNLQVINMSRNMLTNLENNTFYNLSLLATLDLSYNKLEILSTELLRPLKKLQHIFLGSNKLTMFSSELFWSAVSLEYIDLSNNLISKFYNSLGRFHAQSIILKGNQVTKFPGFLLYVVVNLKYLDLSDNGISSVELVKDLMRNSCSIEIDLSNNIVKEVNITPITNTSKNILQKTWNITLNLAENYLKCDCDIFRLDQVTQVQANAKLQVTNKDSSCFDKVENAKCPIIIIKNCPKKCLCYFREIDTSIVVNCSYRNLTKFPEILNLEPVHYLYKHNRTVVSLKGNHLNKEGQDMLKTYDNVTNLDLSSNEISELNWLPEHLVNLSLENNRLTTLSEEVVTALENNEGLRWITLQDNPWVCDCDAYYLQKYLREYNNLKLDPSHILCKETKEKLLHAEICELSSTSLRVALPVGITTVLALISALLALYFRYSTNIKVFLYSKNLCLWFVEEEELDKEKTYDIFISYSHQDESFVQDEILPELESGETPFKLCIHYRDWVPGEFISKQIINSVLDSRRTLVILSNNFMESVWGKMEFRTAHMQAINEGRARVIVIIYGEIDENNLGDEMKAYLKTNTYVKWGDPWFWSKLKYALPHSRNKRKKLNNQSTESFHLKQTI